MRRGNHAARDEDGHRRPHLLRAHATSEVEHHRDGDHRQRGHGDGLHRLREEDAEVRQVDLPADRRHGRTGLTQPLRYPPRVEEQRRKEQGHAGSRPTDQHLPLPFEEHRRAQREHQLGFHQRQAEREPREVRPLPQRDRGPDAEGNDAVQLGVEHHERGRHRGEGGQDPRRGPRARRQVQPRAEAGEPEKDPQPAADVGAESLERRRQQRDPGRGEERKDAFDAWRRERPTSGDVALDSLLHLEVVEVPGIGDDQPCAGRERRPVGVDDIVIGKQRVEDEGQ